MKTKIPNKTSNYFEEIGNKVKSLDEKNLYYLFGGVLVLIFVLDYLVLMRPQLNSLYKLGPNIKALSEDISRNIDDAWNIEEYAKDIKRLSKEFEQVSSRIKSKEEVSIVLEQVSMIADKNHILIDQITPVFQNQSKVLENKGMVYYRLPIDIDARAAYHDIGRFINQLESGDLFFKIAEFSIAYLEDSKLNKIKLTVEVIIFDKLKKETEKDKAKDKEKNKNKDKEK